MGRILSTACQRNGTTVSLMELLFFEGFGDKKLTVQEIAPYKDGDERTYVQFEEMTVSAPYSTVFVKKTQMKKGDCVIVIPGGAHLVFSEEELKAVNNAFSKYIEA